MNDKREAPKAAPENSSERSGQDGRVPVEGASYAERLLAAQHTAKAAESFIPEDKPAAKRNPK